MRWAKQLKSLADTGLHFGESEYDRERYQQVNDIAQAMLASLANAPVAAIARIYGDGEVGYRTPKIDVRAAIIRRGKILLVKEKSDGLWTLPGGYADVGLSLAENIKKEVEEEAGLQVKPEVIYCIRHKAKHEFDPDIRDFYKVYFLCRAPHDGKIFPGSEVSAVDFFDPTEVPPLSTGRVIAKDIEMAIQAEEKLSREELIVTRFD